MGNLISCFTQQTPDSTQSGLSEPLLKKCVSSPKSPEQDFNGLFGEETLPLDFDDETSTSEINGLRQPKFDACIEEKTPPNENGIVEIENFILIKSNGPILHYGKSLQLKCVMFPLLDNIYVIRQRHGKYDEYHITFESMLPYSSKIENYRKFLNKEISRKDFQKSLQKNFPKYHEKLWESFSNEQLMSFRLYE
jgi:hypothetical protein